ncbi:MAG: ferrochelatase [Acidobacteria bacterium]|nr:ferrochelatase [Acidobacteriota bacterium]
MQKEKLVVVLFQLGGPDSLEAVEPFLYNLFCDPDIIDFPFAKIARQPLARLIASSRARKVQKLYAALGGKSPIVEWTNRQARALEDKLRQSADTSVFVAMRYWHPLTAEVIEQLRRESFDELVLLPLYPHYSKTTTGSSLNEWRRHFDPAAFPGVRVNVIESFHNDPAYISSLVEQIDPCLAQFPDPGKVHLVFSAHSLPTKVIESGDPYQRQIEETVCLLMQRGAWRNLHTVCYQSKVGADRWLEPSIHKIVERLAAQGARDLLVIPVSFVSDHIETLSEIDMEVRKEAMHAGIERFAMMPGLNDSPGFISALADLVWKTARIEAIPGKS